MVQEAWVWEWGEGREDIWGRGIPNVKGIYGVAVMFQQPAM